MTIVDLEMTASESYREFGFAVVPGFISRDLADFLSTYMNLLGQLDRFFHDEQVPGTLITYGDPAFETVLARSAQKVGGIVGAHVLPTYSFARVYYEGTVLGRHADRPACEHSVTVHLASSDDSVRYPIGITGLDGMDRMVDLEPGDGLVYWGTQLQHWREPCPTEWFTQFFLHFVDADGPFRSEAFDKRDYLGLPPSPEAKR
ncbi:MAG: hypothetical protein KDB26_13315 [Microthrixaceae bacterium]|nr:hypothetical protein [Microthrixaceae bacterium]